MRPTLPRIPTRAVNMLSVAWITKLINCLEWAMNYPTGDDKTTYRNGETISALRQTGAAIGTGGETYKGYFKLIQTAPNKLKIIDGKDIEATNCGKVQVNNLASQNIAVKELTFTGNAFVYRRALAVMNTATPPVMTSATVTFEQSTAFPEWEAGKEKELVCRIEYTAPVAPATVGTIKMFPEKPLSSRIDIKGAC